MSPRGNGRIEPGDRVGATPTGGAPRLGARRLGARRASKGRRNPCWRGGLPEEESLLARWAPRRSTGPSLLGRGAFDQFLQDGPADRLGQVAVEPRLARLALEF